MRLLYILCVVRLNAGDESYIGTPCAFADVDYNRFTDVLAFKDKTLFAYRAPSDTIIKEKSFLQSTPFNVTLSSKSPIVSCTTGDFDSDTWLDVVLVTGQSDQPSALHICWGQSANDGYGWRCDGAYILEGLGNDVTVIDYNVDGNSDLLVQFDNGTSAVLLGNDNRTKLKLVRAFKEVRTTRKFLNAYVDLVSLDPEETSKLSRSDLMADILLGIGSDGPEMAVYQRLSPGVEPMVNVMNITPSATGDGQLFKTNVEMVGDVSVGDFDADGYIDLLVPYCTTKQCKDDSSVQLALWTLPNADPARTGEWRQLDEIVLRDSSDKEYRPIIDSSGSFLMRVADYTQDGYPDLLLSVVQKGDESKTLALLVVNDRCPGQECKSTFDRHFIVRWTPGFVGPVDGRPIVSAAFFDVFEDGVVDILYEYKTTDGDSRWMFIIFDERGDTTFVKAQTYTPTCARTCRDGREGTVITYAGATLHYTSTDTTGEYIRGAHTQLPQSGRRALGMPFALFGLGRSPNFVDELTIGIPSFPYDTNAYKSFEQLVPNSRMYVVPNKVAGESWLARLYVTPSRVVLISFGAMCTLFAIVLLMIMLLWWRERRQDEWDKQQQSTRFDFNAM